jgi:hypothetical protein
MTSGSWFIWPRSHQMSGKVDKTHHHQVFSLGHAPNPRRKSSELRVFFSLTLYLTGDGTTSATTARLRSLHRASVDIWRFLICWSVDSLGFLASRMGKEAETAVRSDAHEYEEGEDLSWGNMFVNIYYGLMNLTITLGSVGLLLAAYWLFKWANVS